MRIILMTNGLVTDKTDNIKDVTVINKVDIVRDHRIVAYRTKFNSRTERNKIIIKKKCPKMIEIENRISSQIAIEYVFDAVNSKTNRKKGK